MKMRWHSQQDQVLLAHYREHGAQWCAERLGLSSQQIYGRAFLLGLTQRRGPQRHTPHRAHSDLATVFDDTALCHAMHHLTSASALNIKPTRVQVYK